ncbi:PREDICTED: ras-related protein RabC-like [Amphimedon queenslandica]|uniref:Uncharacterized protein n=1 Tax=Amphimedon queenslandica TaxID=400682 RepID=A0A1X7VLB7_AMPQE|nr:PREDICTED: ras-related protein RabC-like [Amphimedon queenslandica]|eukprot:XP_003383560.1 PREDICTED: ras-related protein RabC-like [Amphimedon queenslandica]
MATRSTSRDTGNKIKVILVGESGVGKTSIYKLYEYGTVSEVAWPPTLGVYTNVVNLVVGNTHQTVELEMADTGGSEQFRSIATQYYRNADIAFLVYDITDSNSVQHIEDWVEDIKEYSENNDIKIVLIGNKLDMVKARKIKQEDMSSYAKARDMFFIEMSAKNADHRRLVDDLIREVASFIMGQRIRSRSIVTAPNNPPDNSPPVPSSDHSHNPSATDLSASKPATEIIKLHENNGEDGKQKVEQKKCKLC